MRPGEPKLAPIQFEVAGDAFCDEAGVPHVGLVAVVFFTPRGIECSVRVRPEVPVPAPEEDMVRALKTAIADYERKQRRRT